MANPPRRRPGAGSPLAVRVEPVLTPGTAGADTELPEQGPAPEPSPTPEPQAVVGPADPPAVEQPAEPRTELPPAETTAGVGNSPGVAAVAPPAPERRRLVDVDWTADPKKTVSTQFSIDLRARAETAVLQIAARPGAPRSWVALINGALARELDRLADEYNAGEPFQPNSGEFRTGRPLGSGGRS